MIGNSKEAFNISRKSPTSGRNQTHNLWITMRELYHFATTIALLTQSLDYLAYIVPSALGQALTVPNLAATTWGTLSGIHLPPQEYYTKLEPILAFYCRCLKVAKLYFISLAIHQADLYFNLLQPVASTIKIATSYSIK